MQDFINRATTVLGMTEEAARSSTAALLGFLSSTVPGAEVHKLLTKIPGASELLQSVLPAPPPPPPGFMDSLTDLVTGASTVVQGAMGSGVALVNLFTHIGLDPQKGVEFFKLFLGFARQQAGSELVDSVIDKIPGVRAFLS